MALTYPSFQEPPAQVFEDLYRLLSFLWPAWRQCDPSHEVLPPGLEVDVVEHAPYTTTLRVVRTLHDPAILVPRVTMVVRAYHDAKVAEVIAYQGCERLPPPYIALGDPRYVRDERRQVNRLLRQILGRDVLETPSLQAS